MKWRIRPSSIDGITSVPGDKSIAHRAVMLAALAPGCSEIRDLPAGADVAATTECVRLLGVGVTASRGVTCVVSEGVLRVPAATLDARNSGTTLRLLTGILSGQGFPVRLTGDTSLRRRPMHRIIEPLTRMGAAIESADGYAPLQLEARNLHGITYHLPVASAQVKSAVLLAGLFAAGQTKVIESLPTRDHTERLLGALGVEVSVSDESISVRGGQRPRPFHLTVPGDFSSAAFLLAAAALVGRRVEIRAVGINPTRAAFLDVLRAMGSHVTVYNRREAMGEPVGDVVVEGAVSRPVEIGAEQVPLLIDELPLVALLATRAVGTTVIREASELRVKETDRITAVARELGRLAARVEEQPDGLVVKGPTALRGAVVDSWGDHRLAMMLAVAGTVARGETVVKKAEAAAVSFPEFESVLRGLGGLVDVA